MQTSETEKIEKEKDCLVLQIDAACHLMRSGKISSASLIFLCEKYLSQLRLLETNSDHNLVKQMVDNYFASDSLKPESNVQH